MFFDERQSWTQSKRTDRGRESACIDCGRSLQTLSHVGGARPSSGPMPAARGRGGGGGRGASKMGGLRQKLEKQGLTNITYMVVNHQGSESQQRHPVLSKKVSKDIALYQQLPGQVDVWQTLSGDKDDFLIYDRCGRLTYHIALPYSLLSMPYVEEAIKDTYCKNVCGSCEYESSEQQPVCNQTAAEEPVKPEVEVEGAHSHGQGHGHGHHHGHGHGHGQAGHQAATERRGHGAGGQQQHAHGQHQHAHGQEHAHVAHIHQQGEAEAPSSLDRPVKAGERCGTAESGRASSWAPPAPPADADTDGSCSAARGPTRPPASDAVRGPSRPPDSDRATWATPRSGRPDSDVCPSLPDSRRPSDPDPRAPRPEGDRGSKVGQSRCTDSPPRAPPTGQSPSTH
ncbi:hypothetical protein COCON_G00153130 [Conger conger]|uniref:Selenoprotein P N-terminal domain-containing protein n=1 Tax=Conger conger TaxID=82655 RepID=A0A9Q1HUP8_CONCO|nr:hypothetical protein COCON_G00153130 [Conger conger]